MAEDDEHLKRFINIVTKSVNDNVRYDDDDDMIVKDCELDDLITGEKVNVNVHTCVIFQGDHLDMSRDKVELKMTVDNYNLFKRVVDSFEKLLMGRYVATDIHNIRNDHGVLLNRWKMETPSKIESDSSKEIYNLLKNMLETPLYCVSSCLSLIACGELLRQLYLDSMGSEPQSLEDIFEFVRRNIRHNPRKPFECDCTAGTCCEYYKKLLSMIFEIPVLVHNQSYMLQVLTYLMSNREGREEVFISNLKNIVSPGLLDKIPARFAMLLGTVDENRIAQRINKLRKEVQAINSFRGPSSRVRNANIRTLYSKNSLNDLVQMIYDPKIKHLIASFPNISNVGVSMVLDRCSQANFGCVNRLNTLDITLPQNNNYGRNKCCGYIQLYTEDLLRCSITLLQACVYIYLDTSKAPRDSQHHFYIRDIIAAMGENTLLNKTQCIWEIFNYLDRCDIFTGFANNPLFTKTFYEVLQAYVLGVQDMNEKSKNQNRKFKKTIEKMTDGN